MNYKKGRTGAAKQYSHVNFSSPEHGFASALLDDLGVVVVPIVDGKIHRFSQTTCQLGKRPCWYVLHVESNGLAAGAYGNWKTGEKYKWSNLSSLQYLPPEAVANYRKRVIEDCKQRERAKEIGHFNTAGFAQKLWDGAAPATTEHPYLKRKKIPAIGLRENHGSLYVPLRNAEGLLLNLQRIDGEGQKRFLKGGLVKGCYFLVGSTSLPTEGTIYVCEGAATALTIWQQLKQPVACAMNCGNLQSVCQVLRTHSAKLSIIIAADNDHATPGNPGITKAMKAAETCNACITWPTPCSKGCTCTDFNDLVSCQNKEVR